MMKIIVMQMSVVIPKQGMTAINPRHVAVVEAAHLRQASSTFKFQSLSYPHNHVIETMNPTIQPNLISPDFKVRLRLGPVNERVIA